jgi:hypothetical protein
MMRAIQPKLADAHGFWCSRGAGLRRKLQHPGPPAQGGEVWHRQVEAEQLEDRADQSLGLAQRQVEHSAERQSCRNRKVRVVGLTARCHPRRGFPGGDRLIRKSHSQTAPLPQRLVIHRPVRHPPLRPRNMVAAGSVGLMRHENAIRSIEIGRSLRHPAHPCNTLASGIDHALATPVAASTC